MNLLQDQSICEPIGRSLNRLGDLEARAERHGRWTLAAGPAGGAAINVMLSEDGWLQLGAPVAGGRIHGDAVQRCAWELLEMNGHFNGAAKLVLPPGESVVAGVRDLWLEELAVEEEMESSEVTLAALIGKAVVDLQEALGRFHGHRGLRQTDADANSSSPGFECDLEELCHLAGWPCNRRSEGKLSVHLEIPGAYALAILSVDGGVRALVELPIGTNLSSISRQAIGQLLLALGGQVRGVRSALRAKHQSVSAVLEAQLDGRPSAAALNHLLAALSVAARMSIRELPLLASHELAEKYLSIRGWSS